MTSQNLEGKTEPTFRRILSALHQIDLLNLIDSRIGTFSATPDVKRKRKNFDDYMARTYSGVDTANPDFLDSILPEEARKYFDPIRDAYMKQLWNMGVFDEEDD